MVNTSDTVIGRSAANRLREQYTSWRGQSNTVQLAYEGWVSSDADSREIAYAAYLAALDQEELAADGYRDELAWVTRISG